MPYLSCNPAGQVLLNYNFSPLIAEVIFILLNTTPLIQAFIRSRNWTYIQNTLHRAIITTGSGKSLQTISYGGVEIIFSLKFIIS